MLDWSPLAGFDFSKCPKCRESFRPKHVILEGDPELIRPLLEEQDEDFVARRTESAHFVRKLKFGFGMLACLLGVGLLCGSAFAEGTAPMLMIAIGIVLGIGGLVSCSNAAMKASSRPGQPEAAGVETFSAADSGLDSPGGEKEQTGS